MLNETSNESQHSPGQKNPRLELYQAQERRQRRLRRHNRAAHRYGVGWSVRML